MRAKRRVLKHTRTLAAMGCPYAARLCRLEGRINDWVANVSRTLGPPLPITREQTDAWTGFHPHALVPILPLWTPPACVARSRDSDAGFMLNEHTTCYQRGYCPQSVYDELVAVFAEGFHHPVSDLDGLSNMAYDFIITIEARTSSGTHEIAAGCLVELRCSANQDTTPHLYIFELTTKRTYGRHGLAQQMVHAVDALACLMRHDSETNAASMWRGSLHGRRLFTTLTVDRTQEAAYVQSLIKLYSRCGLHTRWPDTPQFNYNSFTRYSGWVWDPEGQPDHYIAMYKEMLPCVAYCDERVSVAVAIDGRRMGKNDGFGLYYYIIPSDKEETRLAAIRATGLTTCNHECLHSDPKEQVPYMTSRCISFTRRTPAAEDHVFAVWAACRDEGDAFELTISVPAWFAVFIGKACDMLA